MTLAAFYFADPRLVLLPIEHLSERGMSRAMAELVAARGWPPERIDLFNTGFSLYWTRSADLAARARSWPPPRIRHVAVVSEPLTVRPYAQLLNTSAWTMYQSDLDPSVSDPEYVAYLLVHGDRMAQTGEVSLAALHCAAYWFDRSEREVAAYAAAADRATRPDAAYFRAVAAAIGWLRQLFHQRLRPPPEGAAQRPIPGTGLSVPATLEAEPQALTDRCATAAQEALAAYHAAWSAARAPATGAIEALRSWLASAAPLLLVTGHRGRILWDPDRPEELASLRSELEQADAAAVASIHEDLVVVDRNSRALRAALAGIPLPPPPADAGQSGYTYLHRERAVIAYNLHETGMERLHGPALPYARAMLGARTAHEWAHLAVLAGCVPCNVDPQRFAALEVELAHELDADIAAAPSGVRSRTAPDLAKLAPGQTPGAQLARQLLTRMPDYQSNLLAGQFLSSIER
jgi:hypothetical protein